MLFEDLRMEEYEQVDRLMGQLHQVHVEGRPDFFLPLEHPYGRGKYEQLLEDENVIALAAKEEGKVRGICFVVMRESSGMVKLRTAYVEDLAVDPDFRRRGLGKALFLEAKNRAKKLGAERIDLMVWGFNEEARRFYESLGMHVQRYIYEESLGENAEHADLH